MELSLCGIILNYILVPGVGFSSLDKVGTEAELAFQGRGLKLLLFFGTCFASDSLVL